jgi:hypothetical protein
MELSTNPKRDVVLKLMTRRQKHSPWSDGVPGMSQLSIESGSTFTYKWKATQYGTYWYHGHRQGHLEDGLFGAINIKFVTHTWLHNDLLILAGPQKIHQLLSI